jgi:hypothetical protein
MTIQERQSTLRSVAPEPASDWAAGSAPGPRRAAVQTQSSVTRRSVAVERSGAELARRIVALVFGLVQAVILLRIVLLLLDARTGNALVAAILELSRPLVAPFEGVLNTNALSVGGSILDVAAIVAVIGWTLIELLAFALINVFRRGSDARP